MRTIKPPCGEHISKVAAQACAEAAQHNDLVRFTFNGIAVAVEPGDTPAGVEARWEDDRQAEARAYWTPERLAEKAAKEAADIESLRVHMSALEPAISGGLTSLLPWLVRLSEIVFTHTPFDGPALAARLIKAGYADNEFVGRSDLLDDRNAMGRYIVGQAINAGLINMPPHPVIEKFVRQWQEKAAT